MELNQKVKVAPNKTIPATTTVQGIVPDNVKMTWFGTLEPFDEGQTTWNSYIEIMDEFFVHKWGSKLQKQFLVNVYGSKCYDVLRDIFQPEKPAQVLCSYALSERYKFHKITQAHGQVSHNLYSVLTAAQDIYFKNRYISLGDQFV